jgi:hypothetical protein
MRFTDLSVQDMALFGGIGLAALLAIGRFLMRG